MAKIKHISASFWSDPFIENLTPTQKLLFLYLITNEKTNLLGIYELSIKKISFETGIKKDDIEKALKEFEKLKKVKYLNNYVVLINYMKHQTFNTNMKISAIDTYNALPKELKNNDVNIDKTNPLKAFEMLLNHKFNIAKSNNPYIEMGKLDIEPLPLVPTVKVKYYREFKHLKLTLDEFNKLNLKYSKEDIDDILDSIENYKRNTTYNSLYLTSCKWLKKNKQELASGGGKSFTETVFKEKHSKILETLKQADEVKKIE